MTDEMMSPRGLPVGQRYWLGSRAGQYAPEGTAAASENVKRAAGLIIPNAVARRTVPRRLAIHHILHRGNDALERQEASEFEAERPA